MAEVTYVDQNGTERRVDVVTGLSVADGALRHQIPGIEADCGGSCGCSTCHVYVEQQWFRKIPPMDELEDQMLGFAIERRPNSRLSCQIRMDDSLDGLVVTTPARQY